VRTATEAPPASRPAQPTPVSTRPPADGEEIVCEEADVEFDAAGDLPLTGSGAPAADINEGGAEAEVTEDGEVSPVQLKPVINPPVIRAPQVQRNASDAKAFEANSVVKMLLKETNGVIVGVTRK
jgi:hypothetical protein